MPLSRKPAVAVLLARWPVVAVLTASALGSAGCSSDDHSSGSPAPGWGQAEALGNVKDDDATLAGDGLGNAVAVWVPRVGADEVVPYIAVRRFAPATGWTPLEAIRAPNGVSYQPPLAAMDFRGGIVVSWWGGDGLYASRFGAGRVWSAAQLISPDVGLTISYPALSLDAAGNGLAIWSHRGQLWATRFDLASGWSVPMRFPESEQVYPGAIARPALAMSATGDGLAVWTQGPEDARTVWASAYTPGSGWSRQQRIGPQIPQYLFNLGAALSASGHGLVPWAQFDPADPGHGQDLMACYYQPGIGFGPAVKLRSEAIWEARSLDATGNAIVFTDSNPGDLRVHRYTPGSGWGLPEVVDGVIHSSVISVDADGDGWLLAGRGADEIWSWRLANGRTTGLQARAGQIASGDAGRYQLVSDSRGGAVALWNRKDEGASTVYEEARTLVANSYHVP